MEAKILNPEFVYTPVGTCITKRWRELGWIPASEDPQIVAKWQKIQALSARTTASVS